MTAFTLNRLTRREVDAMIDRIADNKPMPANIRQEIIERSDGIPLFVEEITKAVLRPFRPLLLRSRRLCTPP